VHSRVCWTDAARSALEHLRRRVESTLTFDNGYVKIDKVFGAVDLTLETVLQRPSDLSVLRRPKTMTFSR